MFAKEGTQTSKQMRFQPWYCISAKGVFKAKIALRSMLSQREARKVGQCSEAHLQMCLHDGVSHHLKGCNRESQVQLVHC